MPETMDSAGNPNLTELPSLHTPTQGEGSKTPPDPNKLGPPAQQGGGKQVKPTGQAGAPPLGGVGAPPGTGAKPPVPGAVPQKSPEEQLNDDSLSSLRKDINKIVKRDEIEDLDSLLDTLIEEGWRTDRIQDLIDYRDVEDVQQLFKDVLMKKPEEEKEDQSLVGVDVGKPTQLPPTSQSVGTPQPTQLAKKPDNDTTGVNPPKESSNQNTKRSVLMRKVQLKDGVLELKEATDVSSVVEGLSSSRRRVEALLKKYNDTRIRLAGLDALGMGEPGGIADIKPAGGGLEGIISKLKDAIQELVDWLEKGEGLKGDAGIPKKDFDDLEGEMDKGKGTLEKSKSPFEKKEDKEEDKKPEAVASKETEVVKQAEEDDDECGEKSDDDEETKEGTAGTPGNITRGKGSDDAMKVTTGEKGSKSEKKEKKKASEDEISEITASNVIDKIKTRLSEMKKEAQLYPFKDLNKQNQDPINAQTAKDQANEINKEIKQQPAKDKLAPTIHPDGLDSNLKAQKGKVSVEVAERIRQHSVENNVNKAKLAVELASLQQLKGILDCPLKEAMITNLVEYGIEKEAAEAIAHNSFIDGYEDNQKLIMKEAFETFMEKDIHEFTKIAKFVQDYTIKDGTQEPVKESSEESSRDKTASVEEKDTAPLRGTQASKDRREEFRKYWEDVSRERRGY